MYYKVVSVRYGQRVSLMVYNLAPSFVLTYQPGQWVEPRIGKVFILDDREEAKAYLDSLASYPREAWECEAENVCSVENIPMPSGAAHVIAHFWQSGYIHAHPVVTGAILVADRIKLTRRIA